MQGGKHFEIVIQLLQTLKSVFCIFSPISLNKHVMKSQIAKNHKIEECIKKNNVSAYNVLSKVK